MLYTQDQKIIVKMKSLLLKLRKSQPKITRLIYRFFKLLILPHKQSQAIDNLKFVNSKLYSDRKQMVKDLFIEGSIVEVGTDTGEFAFFLSELPNIKTVYTIDLDYNRFTLGENSKIIKIQGDSSTELKKLKFHPNLIYLDGAHDYQSVKKDLEAIRSISKPGMILIANDFAIIDPYLGQYGVHRAISEFINSTNCEIKGLAMESHGLYDIAIKLN